MLTGFHRGGGVAMERVQQVIEWGFGKLFNSFRLFYTTFNYYFYRKDNKIISI